MKKRRLDKRKDFMLAELRGVVESYVPLDRTVEAAVKNDMLWALSVAMRSVICQMDQDEWDRKICEVDEKLRDLFHG